MHFLRKFFVIVILVLMATDGIVSRALTAVFILCVAACMVVWACVCVRACVRVRGRVRLYACV